MKDKPELNGTDFAERRDELAAQLVTLAAGYDTLLQDITESGKTFEGFQAINRTKYALTRLIGQDDSRFNHSAPPPKNIFEQAEPRPFAINNPPAPDLFAMGNAAAPSVINNPPAPDIFGAANNQQPAVPEPPAPKQRGGKVLASSEANAPKQ